MTFRKMAEGQKKQNADDGEGNQLPGTVDVNSPAIQEMLKKLVDEQVSGLKAKNSELLGKVKEAQEKTKQYDGVDFEKIKNLQAQMESNEEMRLLADGKVEEVVSRRVELRDKEWENRYGALDGKVKEYETILRQKEERLTELVIDGQIREAFVQLGYEATALDDMIRLGRHVFIMDENGTAVPRDSHGNIIYGKDAKTPITSSQWLESLAEKKPWLRGASKGAGTQPNRGSSKVDTSKMTSTQRIAEGLKQLGMK